MKEEFVIGEKAKVRNFIAYLFIVSVVFYLIYLLLMNMFVNANFFIQQPKALVGLKTALITVYLVLMIIILTSMSLRQYLSVTNQYLCYFSNAGFRSQIVNTFCILFHIERKPVLKLSIQQIEKITLLFNTITSSYYFKGHSIVYYIQLEDGTSVTINPDSFHFKNDNIVEGIYFMKSKGIQIEDPYNLIEGLKNKDMKFGDYVEKVAMNNESNL